MTTDPDDPRPHVLVVLYSPTADAVHEYALDPAGAAVTIGRGVDNAIVFTSDAVSRRHARLEPRADGWYVVDVGSTHGTFVNEQRVQDARLRRGDRVRVADVVVVFQRADDPRPAAPGAFTAAKPAADDRPRLQDRHDIVRYLHHAPPEPGRPLALLRLAIDGLWHLEQASGPAPGDRVRRAVVALALQHVRPGDILGRYSPDDFGLLLPGIDREGAEALARRLRAEVAALVFTIEERTVQVTLATAVVQVDAKIRSADDLLRAGDQKLYAARPREGKRSLPDWLRRDDERAFIDRVHALGDADRIAYAGLIAKRDPERAEWLRLEVALHARATDDPAVLARFIALGQKLAPDFTRLLLRTTILNCGSEGARREPRRVRFTFACPKLWDTLAPTDDAAVRFCGQCKEQVHRCDTTAEAATRALAGQCIAIPKHLSDGGLDTVMLGRPDPLAIWAEHLFPGG